MKTLPAIANSTIAAPSSPAKKLIRAGESFDPALNILTQRPTLGEA
jgi:hypothetical protein